MTDNIWFGDIAVPWLTAKDTSISRDVVERNFVDSPPQVFELIPDLEAGNYSIILNETVHEKGESFEEQTDAILSMASRHGSEFPFEVGGDKGHLIVDSASTSTATSNEIREAEVNIRLAEDNIYRPAARVSPSPISDDFDVTPAESVYPVPSMENVLGEDPEYSISTEDGDLDFYLYDDISVFEWERDDTDFPSGEQVAPVRLFSEEDGDRVYSESKTVEGDFEINNSALKTVVGEEETTFDHFDGVWEEVGSLDLGFDAGYAGTNSNDEISVLSVSNVDFSLNRGLTVLRVDFTERDQITFSAVDDLTESESEPHFISATDGDRDFIVVVDSDDGALSVSGDEITWESLTTSQDYTAFVGVIPKNVPHSDFASYVYNRGLWDRTMVQK